MTLAFHPVTLPAGQKGLAYDQAVSVDGGVAPYTYQLSAGALPTGLNIDLDGAITGTPTATGTFLFTITAIDSNSPAESLSKSYTVIISDAFKVIVEDGSGVDGANSYISLSELASLSAQMGLGAFSSGLAAIQGLTDQMKNYLIIQSAAYLDRRFRFYGYALSQEQTMEWPRTKNVDNRGYMIDAGTIPNQLKMAQALLVLFLAQDPTLQDLEIGLLLDGGVNSWTMGRLSESSDNSALAAKTLPTSADELQWDSLFRPRLKDVEVLLRSIGCILPVDYLGPDLMTIVVGEAS